MSALASQIAMLRKQSGVVVELPRSPVPEELRRLLGIRTRLNLPRVGALPSADRELPGAEIAPGVLYLEHHYHWDDVPAEVCARFADVASARAHAAERRRPRINFGVIPRQHLLHFDTETTGLAGGTGTRAFMIGAADWLGQSLRVRQLYLTTIAGETAMLETFASWLRPDTVLVSYNGRCYDSPLLATRYRLARMPNPMAGLRHLDLLFPVRRRFRGVWKNCRLATVERQWLGVVRDDDLPGSEAPRAWRDYLRGGSARDLRRVLAHNDQDLRSLGALLLRMGETDDRLLEPQAQ
ncbi:MAG: ribonuclease H-like domain-containing protein [Arenimonas sp.]|jgi:hypothetical protein